MAKASTVVAIEEQEAPVYGPPAPDVTASVPEPAPAPEPVVAEPTEIRQLTHVVLRPFFGAGLDRHLGEVVDASTWRMVDNLVEGRRLRPLERNEPEPVPDGQGRFFIDDDSLLAYIDSIESAVEPNFDHEEN